MRRLQCALLAAVAAIGFVSVASAADMPVKARPVVVAYNWSGCYVGGEIGGQWGRWSADASYTGIPDTTTELDHKSSFIGGGQIGCNWQPAGSKFVFGIEGDVVGASTKFSGEVYRAGTDHFDATGKIGTQGSLRARLGAEVFDRTLLYVAGGVSFANLSTSHLIIRDSGLGAGSAQFDASKTQTGWNIGVGAEYAFTQNWIAGLEYRYTRYGGFDYAIPAGFTSGGTAFFAHTASVDRVSTSDVRLRLNYKFTTY